MKIETTENNENDSDNGGTGSGNESGNGGAGGDNDNNSIRTYPYRHVFDLIERQVRPQETRRDQ